MVVNGVEGFLTEGDIGYLWAAVDRLPPDGNIAEIGSFVGLSTTILARHIRRTHKEYTIHSVDTFKGSPEHQDMEIVRKGLVFQAFMSNIDRLNFSDMVEPLCGESVGISTRFSDNFFDMIFIDGDHSFKACYQDLSAWYPKLKEGGIFIGHDCAPNSGVYYATNRFCHAKGMNYQVATPPLAQFMFELIGNGEDDHAANGEED